MRKLLSGFLFLSMMISCNENEEPKATASENDADAARNFIRSALNGKYDEARTYVLPDSTNNNWIDLFERNYKERMNPDDKRGYRESSINIHSIKEVNDSVSIVNYSNSYKKRDDSLKVVRVNGQWLVDLKYSFPSTITDTLP